MGSDKNPDKGVVEGGNFNPRSPRGERPCRNTTGNCYALFQPTLPAWGATGDLIHADADRNISTHAPRVGSDVRPFTSQLYGENFNPRSPRGERQSAKPCCGKRALFQPTLPAWGATVDLAQAATIQAFQPTLPAWGATCGQVLDWSEQAISTHAPRVGSDSSSAAVRRSIIISTHAPRVGSDRSEWARSKSGLIFQPTLPAWGATRRRVRIVAWRNDFNPRSPRGERPDTTDGIAAGMIISTHAPRVGSDCQRYTLTASILTFQPTLPAWGATWQGDCGDDLHQHFNPRSPRGERQRRWGKWPTCQEFQPTLPAWGATLTLERIILNF